MWEKIKHSRKFWAGVLGALAAVAQTFGVAIPDEVIQMIMVYIIGQGIADISGSN